MIPDIDDFENYLATFIEQVDKGQYYYTIILKNTHERIDVGSLEYIMWVNKRKENYFRLIKLKEILE